MESRAKLAGHAIHPMLITLPLGLLGTAVVFDIIRAFTDDADFAVASFYMLAAGIIGGLLAALFGLVDWLAIPRWHPGQAGRAVAWGWQRGRGGAVCRQLAAAPRPGRLPAGWACLLARGGRGGVGAGDRLGRWGAGGTAGRRGG